MKNITIIISFFIITFFPSLSQIKINEVMHIPANKEPEWIELINFQNQIIDSLELTISDPKGTFPIKLRNILPFQYIVLVKDTNLLKKYRTIPDSSLLIQAKIPSLNNAGDSIVLRNKSGELTDFFYFGKDFGKNGISLERINPLLPADNKENIQPSKSMDSATCGYRNSKSFLPVDSSALVLGVIIEPNPFSPNSEKNKCLISISSSEYLTNLIVNVYDLNGNLVKELINTPSGDKFTKKVVEWDGTNSLGFVVQLGAYPVIIEYSNHNSSDKFIYKKIIVVGN